MRDEYGRLSTGYVTIENFSLFNWVERKRVVNKLKILTMKIGFWLKSSASRRVKTHCQILYELFAQVVINAVHLVFCEMLVQFLAKLIKRVKVSSKWLLHNNSSPSVWTWACLWDTRCHICENTWRDGKVEYSIRLPVLHIKINCLLALLCKRHESAFYVMMRIEAGTSKILHMQVCTPYVYA